jgi:hypothetical protein
LRSAYLYCSSKIKSTYRSIKKIDKKHFVIISKRSFKLLIFFRLPWQNVEIHTCSVPLPRERACCGCYLASWKCQTKEAIPSYTCKYKRCIKKSSSKETPKQVLDKVYSSVGDVTKARSIGELPRGPTDLYNMRFSSKRKSLRNNGMGEINGI